MKRFLTSLIALSSLACLLASTASANFGFEDAEVAFTGPLGGAATQAGSHPFAMTTKLDLRTVGGPDPGKEVPDGNAKDIIVEAPAGLAGTPTPVPYCPADRFLDIVDEGIPDCPNSSVIGISTARVKIPNGGGPEFLQSPVYNLAAPYGVAAKFGFIAFSVPVTVETHLNPKPPYNLIATVSNASQAGLLYGAKLTLWGNPADSAHDSLRGTCLDTALGGPAEPQSLGNCPVGIPSVPFLTLPRACEGPLTSLFEADSWQLPGTFDQRKAETAGMDGCDELDFAPQISARPTTDQAESPSGLNFNLDVPGEGLTSPTGRAPSDIKKAVVTLPEGMTVNPSQAEGLTTCSSAQLEAETPSSEPGAGCPQASKIGSVEVETPLVEKEVFKGSIFVATPFENPFHSLIALYMTVKSPRLGVVAKLAGNVDPDPQTGQLTATFGEAPFELPQIPFSHLRFHFSEGDRSPLVTPPSCGTYATVAEFTPWADPAKPFTATASFSVTHGVGGGPCPSGTAPFNPGFQAGTFGNTAGSFSPFYMRLTRRDGDQELTRFSTTLPPGLLARLAGVSECSDGAVETAKEKSGQEELATPSCPASSEVGRVVAGAGVGPALTYANGKLYLGGPFDGAPLSVIAVVPAVAGPFDLGTVVTRVALQVNPLTGQVHVDGTHSDPIPHILSGIPLRVRDIRAYVDRPDFTLNPTNCSPFEIGAELWGGGSDPFSSADDAPAFLGSPFQAADCASLGFKPRLQLHLKGGTKRGAHPALRSVFRPSPEDANLGGLVLRLPHSAFLEQAHIRTICTRVQFAADACPVAAIYGHATASTPLLNEPLEGPIYLRSSTHALPDLVLDLHGIIDVEAVARIDSKNAGIRASFEDLPDAPISKVVVEMQGGKKGLIVNSRDLCSFPSRAHAAFSAQNGRRSSARPLLKADCPSKSKRRSRGR
jgi:hypothetical protein